jgi:hypothetical protein
MANQPTSWAYKTGRTRLLGINNLKYLDELLKVEPLIYLDEVQDKLDEVRWIAVSVVTLQHAIVQLNISRKGVSKEAAERNDYLLGTWTDTGALTGNLIIVISMIITPIGSQYLAGWGGTNK